MVRGLEPGRRAALLISECQRGVIENPVDFGGLVEQVRARGIVPKIAALAAAFRAAQLPVIHVHIGFEPDYADVPMTNAIMARAKKKGSLKAGSADVQPVAGLEPQPTDIIHSRSFSLIAFHGTELDAKLRHMGVETLVMSGISTNFAISGMSLYASDAGYQVVVAEDCVAGASAESHEFLIKNIMPVYSTISDSRRIAAAIATAAKD